MAAVTLTDKQHVVAGVTVLDEDGEALASAPAGLNLTFMSSDETVAPFTAVDDFNIDIQSAKVGTATITASATFPDGTTKSDTLSVTVVNSAPASLNFTVGEPAAE